MGNACAGTPADLRGPLCQRTSCCLLAPVDRPRRSPRHPAAGAHSRFALTPPGSPLLRSSLVDQALALYDRDALCRILTERPYNAVVTEVWDSKLDGEVSPLMVVTALDRRSCRNKAFERVTEALQAPDHSRPIELELLAPDGRTLTVSSSSWSLQVQLTDRKALLQALHAQQPPCTADRVVKELAMSLSPRKSLGEASCRVSVDSPYLASTSATPYLDPFDTEEGEGADCDQDCAHRLSSSPSCLLRRTASTRTLLASPIASDLSMTGLWELDLDALEQDL